MSQGSVRWAKRFAHGAAAWGLCLAALPAGAQAPLPVGTEFQVNTYTASQQREPDVAEADNGSFVVVWWSYGSSGTDTSGSSIQGQRYGSDGSAQGAEFQVNTYTANNQRLPSVAAAPDGRFVVVWDSVGSLGSDTSYHSIQGQRYASDGTAQGAQFQVNSYTTSYQVEPSVAVADSGDFVVSWMSYGSSGTDTSDFSIQGQRYASDGTGQGAQFQVNSYTTSRQSYPAVTAAANGSFVVVWEGYGSYGTDSSYRSVQGQRYASNGAAQGGQFQVNTLTTGNQRYPSVSAAADGDFVVSWDSKYSVGTDISGPSIQGQRYASNGSVQGAQFQVNTYTTNAQYLSSVAADDDGEFVVSWYSLGSSGPDTGNFSIQFQRFASDGSAEGRQFQVNSYTTSDQVGPSVASAGDGKFVVVWRSTGSSGTDTSSYSIQAQRYVPAALPVPQGGEFQVNTYTPSYQRYPAVAAGPNGSFVVVWQSLGSSGTDTSYPMTLSIQGQRYAANGSAQGAQFQVNTYTPSFQRYPSVAVADDGDFVVVWESYGSYGTDTSDRSIQGQRYASNGSAQGGQFQVNTYTTSYQNYPSVAMDADGDFVVVWYGNGSSGTDTSSLSIQGQRYASNGSPQGGEFQVNTFTANKQLFASVAAAANGDFVVAWHSDGSSGTDTSDYSIQGQRYSSSGSAQGGEFQINTYTTNFQSSPHVAAAPNGDFVVVWYSDGSSGNDTIEPSVQGRRYASNGSPQGGEFQVNTYTTGYQSYPSVAVSDVGDFVVVWHSEGSFGSDGNDTFLVDTAEESVQGQRYASDGSAQGTEFQVNTYTPGYQMYPSVAAAAGGGFVVAWHSISEFGNPDAPDIQGQRYLPEAGNGLLLMAGVLCLAGLSRLGRQN